jgi:hypothetical protein
MAMTLKSAILATSLIARGALSVDIAFVDGADCTGTGLYGTKSIPHLPCYDLTDFDSASSVHMRNITDGQVLHFFSDPSCQIALHSSSGVDDQCFTSPIGQFGSFQVSASHSDSSLRRRDSFSYCQHRSRAIHHEDERLHRHGDLQPGQSRPRT